MPMQTQRVRGGVVPTVRNIGAILGWMVSTRSQLLLHPRGKLGTHRTKGWVGGGALKISSPSGSDIRSVQPIASRCTDVALLGVRPNNYSSSKHIIKNKLGNSDILQGPAEKPDDF
jgi:hypothetical protein